MRVKVHEDAVKRTHATTHKIQCQMRLSGVLRFNYLTRRKRLEDESV